MSEQAPIPEETMLNPTALREVLVSAVGIDPDQLTRQPQTPLADLGLDSIARVELGVVLRHQHGIGELPKHASAMSFEELARHLCRAA